MVDLYELYCVTDQSEIATLLGLAKQRLPWLVARLQRYRARLVRVRTSVSNRPPTSSACTRSSSSPPAPDPRYAYAVVALGRSPAAPIERRVELRMRRQGMCTARAHRTLGRDRRGGPTTPIRGGRHVRAAAAPDQPLRPAPLTIQLMPFHAAGHAAAGGNRSPSSACPTRTPDVVYLEQLTSALFPDRREDIDYYATS